MKDGVYTIVGVLGANELFLYHISVIAFRICIYSGFICINLVQSRWIVYYEVFNLDNSAIVPNV